jgi:hypothetical protein
LLVRVCLATGQPRALPSLIPRVVSRIAQPNRSIPNKPDQLCRRIPMGKHMQCRSETLSAEFLSAPSRIESTKRRVVRSTAHAVAQQFADRSRCTSIAFAFGLTLRGPNASRIVFEASLVPPFAPDGDATSLPDSHRFRKFENIAFSAAQEQFQQTLGCSPSTDVS